MGTKVQCKSYIPGYFSMRDLNEDSSSCSWSLYYEDKSLTNGQYYNGFLPRLATDAYPGYDKDSVKQTILKQEAIFKNQVYELHRLYRIQRNMMDGIKSNELRGNRMQTETSLSSSPLASHVTSEDARKRSNRSFLMGNSISDRPSISGVNGIHSPLSSMEGNMHNGPYSSLNGCSSKDIEALESRPTKVQRKMFDLQLPADEYIDTEGEQINNNREAADSSSYRKNRTTERENGTKFGLDDVLKTDDRIGDILKSDTRLRNPNGLADLNEPIQLEDVNESNASSYGFCDAKIHDSDQSFAPISQRMSLPKESPLKSYGINVSSCGSLRLHKNGNGNGNGMGWFSHVPDVGQRESNLQFPQSSLQTRVSTSKVHEPTSHASDKNKGDVWKEETVFGLKISKRTHNLTNDKNLALLATSHTTARPYHISPLDSAKPWLHSWEKPSSSLSQKPISAQTHGGLNADTLSSKISQGSAQHDGVSGDRWYLNGNASSNPTFKAELPYRNWFYQGSLLGSKEQPICVPSTGDYLSCSNGKRSTNDGLAKHYESSNGAGVMSAKYMNLNVAISDCSSNQEMTAHGIKDLGAERKHGDHLSALPWLKSKTACRNEVAESGSFSKTGETRIFQSSLNQSPSVNQHFAESLKSFSSSREVQVGKTEPSDCPSSKKLLGFPIFEKANISKNDSSSHTSLPMPFSKPSEMKELNNFSKILDINLPCEQAASDLVQQAEEKILIVEKVTEARSGNFRHHIDLNSCLSDDDASLRPSVPTARMKFIAEIDLEAPAVPEAEEDTMVKEESSFKQEEVPVRVQKCNVEVQKDELITAAAEAIMAISASICHSHVNDSPSNPSETLPNESAFVDTLAWFVEIVSSCGDDLEGKLDGAFRVKDCTDKEDDSSEEFDYFESMILQLTETKEEDYMPAPLVPENMKLEAAPTLLTTRPRKGPARRGRQRRDFQRDILPGLASLSRHEVSEDLQTFGGLMRATGHLWQSGLMRRSSSRKGGARGRQRVVVSPEPPAPTTPSRAPLMQILDCIETGLEDRSLTGWGKTPRRPRRQRCSAGNPASIPLN